MVHRSLVGKRFMWFSPRPEGRVWPDRLGSSLNVHKSVPESQLVIYNGPEHVKHVIGGMFPGGSLLRVCSVDQSIVIISVQLLSRVRLFAIPWTAAYQASLSITNSRSLLKLMSIELAMPSNHLILCHHLLLLPSIFPSIWVFSNELVLHIRWPDYWSFSFSIRPSNE